MGTSLTRAHARAGGRGVSRPLYGLARLLLTPPLRIPLRLRVAGRDNLPREGAAIVAPNHKSFVDVFLVGLATRRHLRFMAKSELFRGPLAWLLPRLGAFPVERGRADADAFHTACAILEEGGVVVVFPEGTRVDEPEVFGAPHHGAGRLALATAAPIVPTAIEGTAGLLIGPFPKLRRVSVSFLPPVTARELPPTDDPIRELIDRQVWPAVRAEYGRLRAAHGVIAALLAATGIGAGFLARRAAHRSETRLVGFVPPRRLRSKKKHRWPG